MNNNFVPALQSLGYTEREAAFLYLVATHSGYFLRRQFNYFIERNKGFLAQRFVEKAHAAGHVETIDYGQGFYIYHLFSKPLYRLLGIAESQNRRRKGDNAIRVRLMTLDYVLENDDEHYLKSDEERLSFFTEARDIRPETIPGRLPFFGAFPISVEDRMHPATSLVRFAFMDEGMLSTRRFSRFLTDMVPVLDALGTFELIYTACSTYNFAAAEREFRHRFQSPVASQQRLLLPEPESRPESRRFPSGAQFTTLLFHHSYPAIQRNEPRGSVRGSGLRSANSRANNEVA